MATVRLYSQQNSQSGENVVSTSSMKTPRSFVTLKTVEPVLVSVDVEDFLVFTFPFAPTEISIEGLSDEYAQLERPGDFPLVRFAKKKPITININVLVTDDLRTGIGSAEENLILLGTLARTQTDLIVTGLGPLISPMRYRVTDMSATVNRLSPDNKITMASVALVLTQTVSVTQTVPGMIKIKDVPVTAVATKKKKTKKSNNSNGDTKLWPKGELGSDLKPPAVGGNRYT